MRLLFRCTQHGVTVEFLALAHGEQPGYDFKACHRARNALPATLPRS